MAKVGRHSKPIYLGTDMENGKPVSLDPKWLETHLHLIGPPGSGKTRLLFWLFQQLAQKPHATTVLINPKGALARHARDWALSHGLSKRTIWFDPGDKQFVPGYNPLRPNGQRLASHAKAVREAVRSAWGQSSFDETPQLARLLYLALTVALALRGTLFDALRLLRSGPAGSRFRRDIILELAKRGARGEPELRSFLADNLDWFNSLNDRRQEEIAASSLARLEPFVSDPAISRILTHPSCLDMGEIMAGHKILVVNLEIGRPLRMDDAKLLGRFIVNDVVNHAFASPSPDAPVYLILDEVQNYVTQDLCSILDMGRELGLHCILAHQNLGQLRAEDGTGYVYDSVMKCARTKFLFGGLHVEDLDVLVRETCIEEYDAYKVKDEITTLELDPIESEREVVTHGWTSGISFGSARGRSHAYTRADSTGFSMSEGQSSMRGESIGSASSSQLMGTNYSDITTNTESSTESWSEGTHCGSAFNESHAEGESEGEQTVQSAGVNFGVSGSTSRVPFYEYKKSRRVSSRTFVTEQEFLTRKLQKIKGQPQARAFVKVPSKPGRFVCLPWIRTPWISAAMREAGLERVFSQPFYFRPDEDRTPQSEGEEMPPRDGGVVPIYRKERALPEAAADATKSEVRLLPLAVDRDDENFSGPQVSLKPRRRTRKKKG